jgi:large subunit ribosomal protein L18
MRPEKKLRLEQLRRWRIRKNVRGTKERPRMSVRFTGKNIHVQFIDDEAGATLAYISTLSKSVPERDRLKANIPSATRIGSLAAEAAKSKGISQVVFDRSGARFHGKVEALAKAARGAGLQF